MSFLSWFGKRGASPDTSPSHPSDLGVGDATLPLHMPQHGDPDKSRRRSERVQRRELLYGVVRECMTSNGLLSSTYKFKVLSLDSAGREYMIMMDVPREYLADPTRITTLEGLIARSAKERFDMLVAAVYWRINDTIAVRPLTPPVHTVKPAPHPADGKAAAQPSKPSTPPPAEPSLADEARAFKQAVAQAARGAGGGKSAGARRASQREAAHPVDFSDTEPFDAHSPLGPSQFGGLE